MFLRCFAYNLQFTVKNSFMFCAIYVHMYSLHEQNLKGICITNISFCLYFVKITPYSTAQMQGITETRLSRG